MLDLPFKIGSLVTSGVVQPHSAVQYSTTAGFTPVLVKLKTWVTGVPCAILPKLKDPSENLMSCCAKTLIETVMANKVSRRG